MNLIVVLRAVQDPAGLMVNRRAQKVFVNREAYRLNPADHNALEAALRLAGEDHAVTVVAYGEPPAEDVLRDALAAGARRALWVKDPALQHADAAVLTQVLRAAVGHLGGAEVVMMGATVIDADLAQVAPRLAAAWDGAFVGKAHDLRFGEGDTVQAVVRKDAGYCWVEADTPAVVTIAPDCNQPRYAPAGEIIRVYSTPEAVEVVTLGALGLGEAELKPLTERRGEAFPPERALGVVLEGTDEETARRVVEELSGI